MAFENVDADSLKSAVNSCIDVIKYDQSLQLIQKVSDNNVWNTESRTHLKNALIKLTDTRYKELESKLDTAKQVALLIEEYKRLENDNKSYRSRISALEQNLYRTESYISGYEEDSNGNRHEIWSTRTVIDPDVEREINELKRKIEENKNRMEQIIAQVDALIGGM